MFNMYPDPDLKSFSGIVLCRLSYWVDVLVSMYLQGGACWHSVNEQLVTLKHRSIMSYAWTSTEDLLNVFIIDSSADKNLS